MTFMVYEHAVCHSCILFGYCTAAKGRYDVHVVSDTVRTWSSARYSAIR